MRAIVIIPARYGSTRLPGKPLTLIAGQTMLARVCDVARAAARDNGDIDMLVATDDDRIGAHCEEIGVPWVMTPASSPSGTDRALAALRQRSWAYDVVINLQGDAPLTPPDFITAMLLAFEADPAIEVVTPAVRLSWSELDQLRAQKVGTPFSGTCVVVDPNGNARWFSKQIIPAMRNEDALRRQDGLSPVLRHVGLYGYTRKMLETYVTLPAGHYEQLEGLEQLRLLEHGYGIRVVEVDYRGRAAMSGVDSPTDVARAEALIARHGELLADGSP